MIMPRGQPGVGGGRSFLGAAGIDWCIILIYKFENDVHIFMVITVITRVSL